MIVNITLKKYFNFIFLSMILFPSIILAGNKDKSEIRQKEIVYHLEILPSGDSSLQQIALNEDVYRYSQQRLNDLLVVDNERGPLPFEIITQSNKTNVFTNDIILYPVHETSLLLKQTESVILKYGDNNRLSTISFSEPRAGIETDSQIKGINQHVIGYILDLGAEKTARHSQLIFELSSVTQTQFLRFDIDQSENLKLWSALSKSEVLAQLNYQNVISQHNKITLSNLHSRYLRIRLLDEQPAFSILAVRQKYTEQESIEKIWSQPIKALFDQQENGFIADVYDSIDYQSFQIELAQAPSFIRGRLYSRFSYQLPWKLVNEINFFHVQDKQKSIRNNRIELPSTRAKQLKIVLDYPQSKKGSSSLNFKLAWQPQKLQFFANGKVPYELIVGNSHDEPAKTNNQQLLSMLKKQLGNSIAEAQFGKSRIEMVKNKVENKIINWAEISLWMILVLGVIIMGGMAKRLLKQVDR